MFRWRVYVPGPNGPELLSEHDGQSAGILAALVAFQRHPTVWLTPGLHPFAVNRTGFPTHVWRNVENTHVDRYYPVQAYPGGG